jgi:hypothetical protein
MQESDPEPLEPLKVHTPASPLPPQLASASAPSVPSSRRRLMC